MKLMTLNTHSLAEASYEDQLRWFIQGVLAETPDVIALQEVNQTRTAPAAGPALLQGYVPAQEYIPVRADNHAARVAQGLREGGVECSWTYLPVKVGYDRYDEGLAVMTLNRAITRVESALISRAAAYDNWKTRRVLAVQAEGLPDVFCCVHMGWWSDAQEPFAAQWAALRAWLGDRPQQRPVWLMGDFNAPAEVRGEGYDLVAGSGWHDTYCLARTRDAGTTADGGIDGWREGKGQGMRIDQIWCSRVVEVEESRVMFDGEHHPRVSDHCALLITTPREHKKGSRV